LAVQASLARENFLEAKRNEPHAARRSAAANPLAGSRPLSVDFTANVSLFDGAKYTIAAPIPALTNAMMADLGSSGTELHPGILAIIHRTMVTMLAATPPAMALVAVMEVSSLLIDVLLPRCFCRLTEDL